MLINDLLSELKTISANSIDGKVTYLVRCLYLFFLSAVCTIAIAEETVTMVRGEPVSQSDLLTLSPACKLIFNNPGAISSVGQHKYAALFDQPQYRIAKGNTHFHHYCWALISKQRYFRAHGQTQRNYYFKEFMGDIDYVLNNTADKSWPFFHVLLIEQASMMNIRGDYPNSLLKIDEALRYKPDYDKAYALKSEVYQAMGDKKKAIDTAQTGLEKDPRSRLLRRRLEQLGVKVPPPPPDPVVDNNKENASSAEAAGSPAATQQAKGNDASENRGVATPPIAEKLNTNESGQGIESKPSAPTGTDAVAGKSQDKPVTGTGSQPKDNPYCRFCP